MNVVKQGVLIGISLVVAVVPGCMVIMKSNDFGQRAFKGKTYVTTSDGKDYSRHDRDYLFTFTSKKISYQFEIEGTVVNKEFDVVYSKAGKEGRFNFYIKDRKNLFTLDASRGVIQIFGADEPKKGYLTYPWFTFLNLVPVETTSPLLTHNK